MIPRLRFAKMSTVSVATLQRISAKDLSEKLIAANETSNSTPTIAIIDVRDDGKSHSHQQLSHKESG